VSGNGSETARFLFGYHVRHALNSGHIPGPTELNRLMGWNGGNNLQRAWAVKMRREEFERRGLKMNAGTGRYEYADGKTAMAHRV
jgi:hypothetical protein